MFFTIIIPTYNRAHILPRTIASVLAQTYTNWECIIVDDGSTDNTKEIIASYTDARIRYVYQENAERSAARNNGIRHAQGGYICFLDSDDEYLPEHLEILFSKIKNDNYIEAMYYSIPYNKSSSKYNIYEKILKTIIHSQHVCIHKTIFKTNTFNELLYISEDTELWIRIADEYPIIQINAQTVRINNDSERSISFSKNNTYKKALEVYNQIFKNNKWKGKISCLLKQTIKSDCYFGIAKYYIFHKKRFKAFLYIIVSIIVFPNRQFSHKIYTLVSLSIFANVFNIYSEYETNIK